MGDSLTSQMSHFSKLHTKEDSDEYKLILLIDDVMELKCILFNENLFAMLLSSLIRC